MAVAVDATPALRRRWRLSLGARLVSEMQTTDSVTRGVVERPGPGLAAHVRGWRRPRSARWSPAPGLTPGSTRETTSDVDTAAGFRGPRPRPLVEPQLAPAAQQVTTTEGDRQWSGGRTSWKAGRRHTSAKYVGRLRRRPYCALRLSARDRTARRCPGQRCPEENGTHRCAQDHRSAS